MSNIHENGKNVQYRGIASAMHMCEPVNVLNTLLELEHILLEHLLLVIICSVSTAQFYGQMFLLKNQDLKLGFKSKHVDSVVTESQIIHNKSHSKLFILFFFLIKFHTIDICRDTTIVGVYWDWAKICVMFARIFIL